MSNLGGAGSSSGGGGGGAATIAAGADVTEGNITDAAYTDVTGAASGTLDSLAKGQFVQTAALTGSLTEAAPASDTASSGLNGRLQRIAQRITSMITALGSPFQAGANIGNTSFIATGNVASGATDSGNPVKMGGLYLSSLASLLTGQRGDIAVTSRGQISIATSSNGLAGADGVSNANLCLINDVGGNGRLLGIYENIFNGTSWDRLVKANATARILSSAATTNATSAKASAGNIFMITGRNNAATVIYLKIYNKASAPTVGTDTPVMTIPIPPSGNFTYTWALGRYFSTGIAFALTTGSPDADTGAVASGDITGLNLDYA